MTLTARPRRRGLGLVGVSVLAALSLSSACSSPAPSSQPVEPRSGGSPLSRTSAPAPTPSVIPEAQQGHPAKSSRVRFEPRQIVLPGGASAQVLPAQTVAGVLQVPEHVRHVGWWDGSSYIGDPFGTTVIAGHVDSATEGLGFFAKLLRIKPGEKVTVLGGGHRAAFRVVSIRVVLKSALVSTSHAFDQTGDPRLVLLTCGGNYNRSRGGYDSNVVVTAVPVGGVR